MSKDDRAAMDAANVKMAEALGQDGTEALAIQQGMSKIVSDCLLEMVKMLQRDMSVAPVTSISCMMQISLQLLMQLAPGGPVTKHIRTLCDVYDRQIEGKPPLPAQMQQLEKLGIAISLAARRHREGGGSLQ